MHEILYIDFMGIRAPLNPVVYEGTTKAAPSYSNK